MDLKPTSTNDSLAEMDDTVDALSTSPNTRKPSFSIPRPRSRRRSSNFRPSYYYDSSSIQSSDNIEMLPIVLLTTIFSFLRTKDLLNVCLASRLLYLPAITLLYNRIIIIQQYHPEVDLVKIVPDVFNQLITYYATVIPHTNLPKLTKVLQNKKLSKQVNSIVFMYNVDHDLTKQIHSEFYSSQMDALIKLNTGGSTGGLNLNLKEFMLPNMTFSTLNKLSFKNLRTLSVTIHKDNAGIPLKFPALPCLTTLQVLYENDSENVKQMEDLAGSLVDSNIMSQIECLEFKDFEDLALYTKPHLRNNRDMNGQLALWIDFFKVLGERRIEKLSIFKLAIDGFIRGEGMNISRLLSGVLELSKLTEIDCRVKEFSHFSGNHHENSISLLLNVSSMSESITHVTSKPTHDCLKCQYNMLVTTLMLRSDSLEYLDLTFEFLNPTITKELIQNIVKYQKNLKILILKDKSNQFLTHQKLVSAIPKYLEFEEANYKTLVFDGAYWNRLPIDNWITVYKTLQEDLYKDSQVGLSEYVNRYFKDLNFHYRDFPLLEVFVMNEIRVMITGGEMAFLNHDKTRVLGS